MVRMGQLKSIATLKEWTMDGQYVHHSGKTNGKTNGGKMNCMLSTTIRWTPSSFKIQMRQFRKRCRFPCGLSEVDCYSKPKFNQIQIFSRCNKSTWSNADIAVRMSSTWVSTCKQSISVWMTHLGQAIASHE